MTEPSLYPGVTAALDRVIDPCSAGRGVPSGLGEMGMVKQVDIVGGSVSVTLQLTSPGCHFQLWFFERVRDEVRTVPGVTECHVHFSKDFDWSDDAMAPSVHKRLRQGRLRLLDLG